MGNKSKSQPTQERQLASVRDQNAKDMARHTRKERNRMENEARAARNRELRAQGLPTPHEVKRLARAEARKPKQEEYARVQRVLADRREARAAREDRQREELSKELLREHKSSSTRTAAQRMAQARRRGE